MKYGYARVSTKKQNKSLDDQIYRLKKLDCDVIFSEVVSGASAKRPAMSARESEAKANITS